MTMYTFPLRASLPTNGLRREIDRLFEEGLSVRPNGGAPSGGAWQPVVEAREDATGYTLEIELPGVAPEAVEVLAEDGVLTIRGSKPSRELGESEKAVLAERMVGDFSRRFRLPKSADLQDVTATYALGVLTVRVSKVTPTQPRRVEITVGQN